MFFSKMRFRTSCSELIYGLVRADEIPVQQCIEFVEDHIKAVNGLKKNGLEPSLAVFILCARVLFAIRDGNHQEMRTYNNCKHTKQIAMLVAGALASHMPEGEEHEALEVHKVEDAIKELSTVTPS